MKEALGSGHQDDDDETDEDIQIMIRNSIKDGVGDNCGLT